MSIKDCINTVRKAHPKLNREEALELLGEVEGIVTEIKANRKVANLQEAVDNAVQQRFSDAEREAFILKRNAAISYRTRLAFITKLRETPIEEIPRMVQAIVAGEMGAKKYKQSIESSSRALASIAKAVFDQTVEAGGVPRTVAMAFLRKKENGRFLIMEMDEPGSSNNPTAKAIAEAMEKTNEYLRRQAHKRGADIGRIPGYLARQSHNKDAVASAKFEQWYKDISPLLDEERTFGRPMSEEDKRAFLESAWKSIVMGKRIDTVTDLAQDPEFKGPGNMGKRLSRSRSLHFKQDGEAAWTYMEIYGERDLGTAFVNGTINMSDSIAAMMHLGPNPHHMLKEFMGRARNRAHDEGAIDVVTELDSPEYTAKTDLWFNEVTGSNNMMPRHGTARYNLAKAASFAKNLTSSAVLGGVSLTSFADMGTMAVRLGEMSLPFWQAHHSVLSGLFQGRRSGAVRDIADSMGVGMDGLMAGVQARWLGSDALDGQGSHYVSWVMRITGMNWLNDTLKTTAGLTLNNFIAKQAGKRFDEIDVSLRNEMQSFGILEADFELMKGLVREVDGTKYIDLSLIDDVDTHIRISGFFTGFANSAVLTPGARTNAFVRGERGTAMGEFKTLFFHLKSFSLAYGQEILSRAFSKANEGKRTGMLAHILVSSMVYGYLATMLKDLAKGRMPADPTREPHTIAMRSLMAAGGLGFYGDFLVGQLKLTDNKFGRGAIDAVAGPVIGNALTALSMVPDAFEGDWDKFGQKSFRVAKSLVPGANVFYTRQAIDYLMLWEISEYLNPGWARNFERRVKEETGQEFFDTGIPPFRPPTRAVR